jgi:hypothetical protein
LMKEKLATGRGFHTAFMVDDCDEVSSIVA